MKIGVTGGAGFIGSHIVDRLLDDDNQVLILDHQSPGILASTLHDERVQIFHGDVRDATTVTEFAAHVDGIIHLAAVLGTQETINNPRPSAETNILGGLNVFEAAVQYDLPVVYAGVGNHWMRDRGAGSYTITKTAVEDFAKMFNAFRGGKISVVRPVNAYGPRQSIAAPYGSSKVRKILPSFAARALLGDDIEVYGGGVQISDCIHVSDVADVFVRALYWTAENGPLPHAVEVGPTESVTVREIAETVRQAAYEVTGNFSKIKSLPMRPGEVPNAVVSADVETLKILDIDPAFFVSLDSGIADTVAWYAEHWLLSYKAGQA